jgi:hypothetical protein
MPRANPPSPWALVLVGLFFALGSVPIGILSGMEIGPELTLRASGKRAQATVTESRVMHSRRMGDSFEVRYRFKVKGHTYTHQDATGRTNLWSSLPEENYKRAVQSKRVAVLYLGQSPKHNRPVHSGAMPLGDVLAGFGLAGMMGLLGLFSLGRGVFGLRARGRERSTGRAGGAGNVGDPGGEAGAGS